MLVLKYLDILLNQIVSSFIHVYKFFKQRMMILLLIALGILLGSSVADSSETKGR